MSILHSLGLSSVLSWFLSPWGLLVLSALDGSPVIFLPFANDIAVTYLVAGAPHRFWLYPIVATAGSLAGAAVTHRVGKWLGEEGLER